MGMCLTLYLIYVNIYLNVNKQKTLAAGPNISQQNKKVHLWQRELLLQTGKQLKKQ
jgi:hypothetical protein